MLFLSKQSRQLHAFLQISKSIRLRFHEDHGAKKLRVTEQQAERKKAEKLELANRGSASSNLNAAWQALKLELTDEDHQACHPNLFLPEVHKQQQQQRYAQMLLKVSVGT